MARNMQSLAVRVGRSFVVVDAGEGTQHQIMKHNASRKDTRIRHVSTVLVTHLHGDHAFGLPGLLCALDAADQGGSSENKAEKKNKPIKVVGPRGLRAFLRVALGLSRTELPNRGYVVVELRGGPDDPEDDDPSAVVAKSTEPQDVELSSEEAWVGLGDEEVEISAAPLDHAGMPCVAYALAEKAKLGKIDAAAVRAAAVRGNDDPKRLFAALRGLVDAGETELGLRDGSSFPVREAFVGGQVRTSGRKVVVFGDCRPSRQEAAKKLARGADLVVHEATLETALADVAFDRGHSTPADAGRLANAVEAQTLVLWHVSPRYTHDDTEKMDAWARAYVAEASAQFTEGTVLLANDFDHVTVPPPRPPRSG